MALLTVAMSTQQFVTLPVDEVPKSPKERIKKSIRDAEGQVA